MSFKAIIKTAPLVFVLIYAFTNTQQPSSSSSTSEIKLITSDGEISIPMHIATQSSYIKNAAIDTKSGRAMVPFPKAIVEPIIACLEKLNDSDQNHIKPDGERYIAQRIQPIIDTVFSPLSNVVLASIPTAAEYLDLRYIANGVIRLLVQKILSQSSTATAASIENDMQLPIYLRPIINYQYQLIKSSNIPELSVADLNAIDPLMIANSIKDGRSLDLSKKKLTSLEGLSVLNNTAFKNIEKINLEDNQLIELPEEIFKLFPKLRYLYLKNNRLTQISENSLKNLLQLNIIDLSHNDLTTLPANLFKGLKKLTIVRLHYNNIKQDSLPMSLFDSLTPQDGGNLGELVILLQKNYRVLNKGLFISRYFTDKFPPMIE
jgi:Leucine-rich repeat (LRR) protein